MKKLPLLLILVSLLLPACYESASETQTVPGVENGVLAPVCRHNALLAAWSWHDLAGSPTRIFVGPSGGGQYHAQAQALIDESWVWLSVHLGMIFISEQESFTPETEFKYSDFFLVYGAEQDEAEPTAPIKTGSSNT